MGANFNELVETVKKYSTVKLGEIETNGDINYRYDLYICNYRYTPFWLVKLFNAAAKEMTGREFNNQIAYNEISMSIERPHYIGEKHGKISMMELVIL